MVDRKYYTNKREDIIRLIPTQSRRVLDVGCGYGAMGSELKRVKGRDIEVVGIERDPSAASAAMMVLDKVFVGDAENIVLPFGEGRFDCIIYGDLLEHLIDPWALLKSHRALLSPHGRVVASIPNIAHYRIVKMLRKKEWNYGDAGILDRSHIRFFTIKSIQSLFEDSGLRIVQLDRKIGASNFKKIINRLAFDAFIDHITEQYIVAAEPA